MNRYALVSDVVEFELRPEGSVVATEPPEVLVCGSIGSRQKRMINLQLVKSSRVYK